MAAANDLGLLFLPQLTYVTGIGGSFTLDNTSDRVEVAFFAERATTITRLWYYAGTATGSPSVKISLQGFDTSTGRADGVVKSSGNAAATWSPTSNTWGWQTLTGSYACSRGEALCIVYELLSGTSQVIGVRINDQTTRHFPTVVTYDSGGPTTTRTNTVPVYGWGDSTHAYGNPWKAARATTFSAGEYGNLFTIPASITGTLKLSGVRGWIRVNASSSFSCAVYAGSAVTDTTVSNDSGILTDTCLSASTNYSLCTIPFNDTTMATFNAGDSFRISVRRETGTVGLAGIDVAETGDLSAFDFWGGASYSTTRSGGNWTDTNTTVYGLWPILEDMTTGGGGGGLAMPVSGRIISP